VSRSPRTRRTGVAAIGVVIGALALAGCGSGQITQTDTSLSVVNGAQATVGNIAVRDAKFEYAATDGATVYPRGGDGPLELTIVNSGATDDKLISASSPMAGSVEISGNPVIAGGRALTVAGRPQAPVLPSAEPTGSVEPSPTVHAAAPHDAFGQAHVVLIGLTKAVQAGLNYPVTLTFQKAGAVTFEVPVAGPTTPRTESAHE
jgi:copper(I)-binding protein